MVEGTFLFPTALQRDPLTLGAACGAAGMAIAKIPSPHTDAARLSRGAAFYRHERGFAYRLGDIRTGRRLLLFLPGRRVDIAISRTGRISSVLPYCASGLQCCSSGELAASGAWTPRSSNAARRSIVGAIGLGLLLSYGTQPSDPISGWSQRTRSREIERSSVEIEARFGRRSEALVFSTGQSKSLPVHHRRDDGYIDAQDGGRFPRSFHSNRSIRTSCAARRGSSRAELIRWIRGTIG